MKKPILKRIKTVLKDPWKIVVNLSHKNRFKWMEDEKYLKFTFRAKMHRRLDLDNPITMNEKLQWLKLYDRKDFYHTIVDKYEVRSYIKKVLGEEYLVPLLGVWERFEEIDFDALPDEFVLKTTHDSGGVAICHDKKSFDINKARKKLNKSLKNNYYYMGREWPYKDIKPRIIAEAFMDAGNGTSPDDYKILCFNGIPENIMVCTGRESGHVQYFFFDFDWHFLKYNYVDELLPDDFTLPRPANLEKMYKIAEKLSEGMPLSRIDLYEINGKIYFGEITLFPDSGFDNDITYETDLMFGKKLKLPSLEEHNDN